MFYFFSFLALSSSSSPFFLRLVPAPFSLLLLTGTRLLSLRLSLSEILFSGQTGLNLAKALSESGILDK